MMQDRNPFDAFDDDDIPLTQSAPGIIRGRPKQPTALELRREARADEDQVLQREAAALAEANAARAALNDERRIANENRRDQRQATIDARGAENERTAAFLATRLAGSLRDIKSITATNPAAASPELDTTLFGAILPSGLTNTADRQRVEDAQIDILDAALTLGTGAAYTKEQLEGYRQSYFPQYFDGPEAVRDKQARLQRVLDAARIKAGVSASAIDEALGLRRDEAQQAETSPARPAGQIEFGGGPTGAPPGGDAYVREVEQGIQSGAITTPEQVQAIATRYGLGQIDPDALAKSFEQLRAGARFGGAQAPEYASVTADRARMEAEGRADAVIDPLIRGAADTASLGFADEIAGIGTAIATGGNVSEEIARQRAIDDFDEQNNSRLRLGGQIVGGFALPTFGATSAGQLARLGAAYGGGYGFGSADGTLGERALGAAAGAATGGAAGYGLARLGQAASARLGGGGGGAGNSAINQGVVDAAERQRVDLVRPDVQDSRRGLYALLESLPISGNRVRSDLQRGAGQIEQRVADIGGGAAAPRQTVGENVRTGAERYVERSRTVVGRLYDRAANLAGNTQVQGRQALTSLDDNLAELARTPNANRAKIEVLEQFRSDLIDDAGNLRPLSIQAIRDLRTAARDELSGRGLRYTDAERRVMQFIDAASADVAQQLQASGNGAALRAYQRADRAYKERRDIVDNVVQRFIGNSRTSSRSGEAVVSAIENAAKPKSGDAEALNRLMQRLEPNEREEVSSLVASQLGRRGVDDEGFSPARFFTDLKAYSPEARTAIFGKQGAADLADLAVVANARSQTLSRLNNTRSGAVGNWYATLRDVLAGGGAGAVVGGATGLGVGVGSGVGVALAPFAAGAAFVTARALGNRMTVQTLAQAARARTPAAQQSVIRRLNTIIQRSPQPGLAQDLLPIRDALSRSIGNVAASDEPRQRRE